VGTNGKDTQLLKFTKVVHNPVVAEGAFELPALEGWTVVDFRLPDPPSARPRADPLSPVVYSEPAGPTEPLTQTLSPLSAPSPPHGVRARSDGEGGNSPRPK
jgi:hypothetical protein